MYDNNMCSLAALRRFDDSKPYGRHFEHIKNLAWMFIV